METIIITNNPKVNIDFLNTEKVDYREGASQREILIAARDLIHLGAKLIMHPMMGRIKPHETPYKSVFLELCEGPTDVASLVIIEDSIAETDKFLNNTYALKYGEEELPDLQFTDCLLLREGIEEYRR